MKRTGLLYFKYADAVWFVFSVLLSIGFLLLIFADLGDTSFSRKYFNSDMLYDPVIFKDIFVDKTGLNGWHLNAAPNFFPDMFIYFVLMGLSGNLITANFLFSIFQYISILLLVYWLFHNVNRDRALQYATVFNYFMFLFLLMPIFTTRFHLTFQVISISYHIGSFIMYLLSMNLLLLYFRNRKNRTLLLLFLTVTLGALNDRLFISQFVLPILALSLLLLLHKEHRRNLLRPIIVVLISTITGLVLFRIICDSGVVSIIGTGFKMFNFENLAFSWSTFWKYIGSLFLNYHAERIILVICSLSLILGIAFTIYNRNAILFLKPGGNRLNTHYLVLLLTIYIPVTLLTPVLNGAFVADSIIRFNIMSLYTGLLLFPLIIMIWLHTEKSVKKILRFALPVVTILFLTLFMVKFLKSDFREGMKSYFQYYPEKAQVLDKLQEEHDLKYGLGDYWYAKYITMLSRKDVRIYTVFEETLRPFYHSTNKNWYHNGGKGRYKDPVFNYFIRISDSDADSEKLKRVFTSQIDTIYIDPADGWVVVKVPEFKIDRETREIVLQSGSAPTE